MTWRPRNVCFTLNNYTDNDVSKIVNNADKFSYLIFGKETGESGTPHLQGYAEWKESRAMSTWKKLLGDRIHLEERMGSAMQAAEYCKKENNFSEFGEISKQGNRSDLGKIGEEIIAGKSLKDIALENPGTFIKFNKGFTALKNLTYKHRDPAKPPKVLWLWGDAGVGKTKYAFDRFEADDCYIKDSTKWWNGYTQQPCVIIDDFDHTSWDYRSLLRILDRYKLEVENKGGYIPLNSDTIIITCEYAPEMLWHGNTLKQITRRITEIIHIVASH